MKKLFSAIMIFGLILSGCGSGSSTSNSYVTADHVDMTVNGVEYINPNDYDVDDDEVNRVALVNFDIKNIDDEDGIRTSELYFDLETDKHKDIHSYTSSYPLERQGIVTDSSSTIKIGSEDTFIVAFPLDDDEVAEAISFSQKYNDVPMTVGID